MNIPASAHTDLPTRCEPYLCLFALCYSPSSCPPLLKFKVTSCCSYLCLIIPVQIKVFLVLMTLTYLTLILITSFCAHCNIKVQIHMKCYFFGVVMCLLLSCCGVFFSFVVYSFFLKSFSDVQLYIHSPSSSSIELISHLLQITFTDSALKCCVWERHVNAC